MDYLPPARRRAMAQAVGCDLSQSELAVQNPVMTGREPVLENGNRVMSFPARLSRI